MNSICPSLLLYLDFLHNFGPGTLSQLQSIRDSSHCLIQQVFISQIIALCPFLVETKYFVLFGLKWVWKPSPCKHLSSRAKSNYSFRVLVNLVIWFCVYFTWMQRTIRGPPSHNERSGSSTAHKKWFSRSSGDLFTLRNSFALDSSKTLRASPRKNGLLRRLHIIAISVQH